MRLHLRGYFSDKEWASKRPKYVRWHMAIIIGTSNGLINELAISVLTDNLKRFVALLATKGLLHCAILRPWGRNPEKN
jgi:hypothetical protein